MGNPSEMNKLIVGEIVLTPNYLNIQISCFLPEPANVTVIIQDNIGRPRCDERFLLSEGHQLIDIDVSHLGQGTYNAWIDILGQTFIRSFYIEKKKSNESWYDKVRNFFD